MEIIENKTYILHVTSTCFGYLNVSIKVQDSSVGIATLYELGGSGIESRWGRDFPHQSRPALGLIQPPIH